MKKLIYYQRRKFLLYLPMVFILFAATLILTTGCPETTNTPPPPEEYSFTGKIIDTVTGEVLPGITVDFNNSIVTTDSNGTFTISLGENESITSPIAVYETTSTHNYQAKELSILTLTGATDKNTRDLDENTIFLDPISTDAYPTKNISGRIYIDLEVELDDGSDVYIIVRNSAGGISVESGTYSAGEGGGYSFDIPTFGPDCFIEFYIIRNTEGNPTFNYYASNVDFSSNLIDYDITQPSESVTSVSVSGGDAGDRYFCIFRTPYGDVPLMDPNSPLTYVEGSNSVSIYNPENYQVYWQRQKLEPWNEGNNLVFIATSDLSDFSDSGSLPSITTSSPDEGSITPVSYDPDTRTLSVAGLPGFDGYMFVPKDGSDNEVSHIFIEGTSVVIPENLANYFSNNDPFTMTVSGLIGSADSFSLLAVSHMGPPLAPSFGPVAYTLDFDTQENFYFE